MRLFRTARTARGARTRRRGCIRAALGRRVTLRPGATKRGSAGPGRGAGHGADGTGPPEDAPAPGIVRPPRAVRRSARLPRAGLLLLVLLACLPALAVVLGLVLWATGGGNGPEGRAHHPATARPTVAYQAARPPIVPRARWLGGAGRSQPPARYDDRVLAVFVHHTDSPNDYDCADTPRVLRDVYTGQTGSRDWDDIGYNFLVDRCGTIYEGRAGGVERPVTGAHTQGFNHRTAGIAAVGTFTAGMPVPRAMTDAIAALAAWKLGLSDVDPRGGVRLVSSNDRSRYPAGTAVLLPAVAGHSDGYRTSCPGAALAERLPGIRETAARLQGRPQSLPGSRTPVRTDAGFDGRRV